MTVTATQLDAWIVGFVFAFLRTVALLLAAPIFGARSVPRRVRVALALVIALLLTPLLPAPLPVDLIGVEGAAIAAREILIGVSAGFALQLAFGALAVAGEAIALGMGLGFASLVDPLRGEHVPLVGQQLVILATLIFLAMDGHLALIRFLALSFTGLPAGLGAPGEGAWPLVEWGGAMFAHAVLIALPAVGALLLANLCLGVITRAAPQLNVFAVGFPLTLLFGFVVLWASLPTVADRIVALFGDGLALVGTATGG